MLQKVKVSIIGAAGYTGLELLRLLAVHPHAEVWHLVSHSQTGKKISDTWPHLQDIYDQIFSDASTENIAAESDLVFLALPHGEAHSIVPRLLGKTRIIDLSGDFRLKDTAVHERFYGKTHGFPAGIQHFTYGLSEFFGEEIAVAQNIANPGCFAITAQLALFPLKSLAHQVSVLAITGSSGAGKTPSEESHHPVRNHNMKSYKINVHQHIPEILQTIGLPQEAMTLVPTSGPFTRGIHLTAFVDLKRVVSPQEIIALFDEQYDHTPFVRIKSKVQVADVIGSNFCDIAVYTVAPQKIVVQAVLDNLIKGAAGGAVQNMNLIFGFPETSGLAHLSPIFP